MKKENVKPLTLIGLPDLATKIILNPKYQRDEVWDRGRQKNSRASSSAAE